MRIVTYFQLELRDYNTLWYRKMWKTKYCHVGKSPNQSQLISHEIYYQL